MLVLWSLRLQVGQDLHTLTDGVRETVSVSAASIPAGEDETENLL